MAESSDEGDKKRMVDVHRRDRGDRRLEKGKRRERREHQSPEEDEKEQKKGVDRRESQDREEGEVEKGEWRERRRHDSSEEDEKEHKKEVDKPERREREDGELEKRERRDRRKHESSEEDEKEHKEVDRRGRRNREDEELDKGRKRDRRKHESSDDDENEHKKEVERWESRHRENEVTEKGKRREKRRKYESSEEEKEHNEEVERGERRRSRRDGESNRDTRSPEHRRSRRDDDYRHSRREKFQHRSPVDHRQRRKDRSPEEDQRRSSRRERGRVEEDGEDRRSWKDVDRDSKKEEIPGRLKDNDRLRKNAEIPGLTAGNQNPAGDVATLGRTGGVYIPPFKLARMMKEVEDKSSTEYQRLTWDALRKSINGLVNKVNATNIKNIIPELFGENLIRGRGLFCRSCMKSQLASPGFTDVFAALVAVVNTKFPEIGDLLLRRLVLQLKRAYKRNDKPQLLGVVKFVAHLVNQQVAHELIALELLTILLGQPTDDSVEVAVGFVTECGSMLQDLSPKGLHGIFERFRGILHEGEIDKRVQFLIEGLFAIRKAKFQGYPAIRPELDLVEPEDQLTHEISLMDDEIEPETALDIFKPDPNFVENEKKYEELKKSILGEESEDEEDGSDAAGSGSDEDDDEEDEEDEEERMEIQDQTETNLVNLRRTIYLTIMSSVDFEEAGHKLLKIKLEPGQEMELCIMLLECCSQERTYLRYYGLLGQRFCMINKVHQENFETCFVQQYSMIHRLETNKLRNVAKFFAHLLGTDALPWNVLSYIRLTEEDTTSSSRIFIKILFQELSEHLGIRLLNERLNDPTMIDSFESIFPKDNPKNTRFSINFFTSIGLGGITENLREYLKNMPRLIMQQQKQVSESEDGSGPDDSGSSDSDSPSSSSSSSSESGSESESDRRSSRKRRRR